MHDRTNDSHKPWSAVLAAAAGFSLAWWAGWLVEGRPWPIQAAVFAAGLGACAGLVHYAACRCWREQQAVWRHFEALSQLDPRELRSDAAVAKVPPIARNNPWRALADRVEETLVKCCGRLQELEHSRAALEIRCQRASDRYERIKAILTGLTDPVLAINEFDELVLANPAAQTLLGLDAERPENQTLAKVIRCQKLVDLLINTNHRKSAAQCSEEIELADPEGRTRWYRATASRCLPVGGDGSRTQASGGAVAVLRDIEHQRALQKRNAEFVSAVSHEMKTPLAGIKAYVELLADGDAEDEATREEFLTVINSQADRLQRLVDNLLNLARIEAGVVKVNKQSRSLNELLEEAVHVVQPSAEAKQIALATELSPLYLGVFVDRDMLLQAAINLLSNAIKYTPAGGRVTVRSRLADQEVAFEVADTGVGLSAEDCVRVFEKFYRVAKDKDMAPGTGLGLALAKHIVEDVHGGRLTVQSALGAGSTFTVTLPHAGQMT